MNYPHRLTLVCAVADIASIRSWISQFESVAQGDTVCSFPLSSDGSSTTHYAASTVITDAKRQSVEGGSIPNGMRYQITPNGRGSVRSSNVNGYTPVAGATPFSLFTQMSLSRRPTSR